MEKGYRVLTADDEYWSRENIRNLLPWETYDIEFLEPAADGEEVLARIPIECPDIVMTDINMPFVSGLELLEKIHDNYPEIVTVAISGYDDFKKVKGAFMAGGVDYLLKPVSREQMVGVLKKALEVLEERDHNRTVSSFMEDNEFSTMLSEKLYDADTTVEITKGRLEPIPAVFLKIHNFEILAKTYKNNMPGMSLEVKKWLNQILAESFSDDREHIVFNYSAKVNEFIICIKATRQELNRLANRLAETFVLEKYGSITVIYKDQSQAVNDMARTYRDMVAAMMRRPFASGHFISSVDGEYSLRKHILETQEVELRKLIENGEREPLSDFIFRKCGFNDCDNGWSVLEVSQFVAKITSLIFSSKNLPKQAVEMREEVTDSNHYALLMLDKAGLINNINMMISLVCKDQKSVEDTSIVGVVQQIHDYIFEKYYEHFSLPSLGEQYHIDPTYLSRTFSKQYGESIIAFVTRIRIDKAKELMKTNRSFEAISFEIGYDDYNYFSRVFKKQTGMSPSEYKKQFGGQENE